ncbi:MAG: hypothetical protein ABL901_11845 [Hyphomicrobiaceae bacterium]
MANKATEPIHHHPCANIALRHFGVSVINGKNMLHSVRVLRLLLAASLLVLPTGTSNAGTEKTGTNPVHRPVLKNHTARADGYFVEFLARPSEFFGHAYVRLGTNSAKRETTTAIAGLYPDPKRAKTVFAAPGTVGYTAPDQSVRPTARYRLAVSKQTYDKTKSYLAGLPKTKKRYDLFEENCNHFADDVAGRLGLKVPGDPNDLPDNNVRTMKSLNDGRARASWRSKR